MTTNKRSSLVGVWLLTCLLLLFSCGGQDASDQYEAGLALMEQGRWDEAIVEFEAATSALLTNAGYRRRSGDFARANEIKAMHADALVQISTARTKLGQHQLALTTLDAAIRIDSGYAPAYANRALARTRLGLDSEAEQDVSEAATRGHDVAQLEREIEDIKKTR